jgi:hypothetical protein
VRVASSSYRFTLNDLQRPLGLPIWQRRCNTVRQRCTQGPRCRREYHVVPHYVKRLTPWLQGWRCGRRCLCMFVKSHCLTDCRFLVLLRTASSDAPNQVRADFVSLKAVFAFLPAHAGPIASSSNGLPTKTCRPHFNTVRLEEAQLRVNPQREFVRQVASRSPSSFRHWDVNPENRQTRDANRQQFNRGKGIDEQNSDCG